MAGRLSALVATESARLRGAITAVFALLFAAGVVRSSEVPAWADAVLLLVVTVAPLLQAESTRKVVTPVATVALPEVTVEPVANGPTWRDPVQDVSQGSDPVVLP